MNKLIEEILDKTAACISADLTDYIDLKPKLMAMFRAMGTEHREIIFKNAHQHTFPVKAVDEYLRKHPEKVRKVTVLRLEFNRRKSVQLLEMVRKRFPNIRELTLIYSNTHPIGHALAQYAQMPNLRQIHFGFSNGQLAEHMKWNDYIPLTQVKSFLCGIFVPKENFANFEASMPIMFPNLEHLHYLCPNAEFAEQIRENVQTLFPKMKRCDAVDGSDIPAIVRQQERPCFPIEKLFDEKCCACVFVQVLLGHSA